MTKSATKEVLDRLSQTFQTLGDYCLILLGIFVLNILVLIATLPILAWLCLSPIWELCFRRKKVSISYGRKPSTEIVFSKHIRLLHFDNYERS